MTGDPASTRTVPTVSRRAVVVGCTAVLGGCRTVSPSGERQSSSTATTTGQEPPAANDVVRSKPTCGETDADQLVTVTPRGVVFLAQNRADARGLRDTILGDDTKGAQRDDIRLVTFPESDRVAVELDDTEFAAYTEFRSETGVITVRKGRSLPTVTDLATSYRSQITESEAITPSGSSITYVQPEAPAPLRFTLALSGVGSASVLKRLVSFEVRIAGPDGERTVLTGTDIDGTTTMRRNGNTRITMVISESAQERFLQALRDAEALTTSSDEPIRVYSNGEQLVALGLSRGLVKQMQAGESRLARHSGRVPGDGPRAGDGTGTGVRRDQDRNLTGDL